jgi:hypothetical protein
MPSRRLPDKQNLGILAPLAGDNLFPLFAKPAILALGDFLI